MNKNFEIDKIVACVTALCVGVAVAIANSIAYELGKRAAKKEVGTKFTSS